jgi:hypothetical protein
MADTELRAAAVDVLKRWDSPLWREESTAELMSRLRAALASRPAEVDDEGLPPLPHPVGAIEYGPYGKPGRITDVFIAEQFRQGQRDAVAADRARRLKPRNIDDGPVFNKLAYDFLDSGDMMSEVTDARYVALVEYINEWAAPSHTTNKEK